MTLFAPFTIRRPVSRSRVAVLSTVGALALVACSGSDSGSGSEADTADTAAPSSEVVADTEPDAEPDAEPSGDAEIVIERSRYMPSEIEVDIGEEVVVASLDPFAHTVTSADDSPTQFDSGEFVEGETFSISFDEAGAYPFFCQIHPTMRGTITVG